MKPLLTDKIIFPKGSNAEFLTKKLIKGSLKIFLVGFFGKILFYVSGIYTILLVLSPNFSQSELIKPLVILIVGAILRIFCYEKTKKLKRISDLIKLEMIKFASIGVTLNDQEAENKA